MTQNFGSSTGSGGASETAQSIKTKYESNNDTNAFTDAHLEKLNSIETADDISSFKAAFHAAFTAVQPIQEEIL